MKAVAIYRDGCKQTQPLNTRQGRGDRRPLRRRRRRAGRSAAGSPNDCESIRHKFEIAGHEGYIHVGFYEDGTPGEIFIKMAKEGSTISGLMDTIATLTSMALQYGVPLEVLVNKFAHVRFEPSGFTKNPEIPMAKSLTDYIFRFLGARFLSADQRREVGLVRRRSVPAESAGTAGEARSTSTTDGGALDGDQLQPAGRCAELLGLRLDHDPQRQLLQVSELRCDQRVLLRAQPLRRARVRRALP